jgi:serine phosphatase RsbU (regulator of sigma subunit)
MSGIHPDDRERVQEAIQRAHSRENDGKYCIDYRTIGVEDGKERWLEARGQVIFDDHGKPIRFVGGNADVTDAKRGMELSEALNRINDFMHSTVDFEHIMANAFEEGVRALGADAGAVEIREDGFWVLRYQYGFPPNVVGDRLTDEQAPLMALAAASRSPVIVNDTENDPRVNLQTMRGYGIRSIEFVPLVVSDTVIGGLSFNYMNRLHTFTDTEIDFLTKLGASISMALENARLFEEQKQTEDLLRTQIHQLQQALSPKTLPRIEGYSIASRYLPAYAGQEIGGDFYDVLKTEDGMIGILIGDVSGKGIPAAALATVTRSTVGAFAYDLSSPHQALTHANSILCARQEDFEDFVTVFVGILDPSSGCISYSNAGHPPGLICRTNGMIELLPSSNMALGISNIPQFSQVDTCLMPGDKLVLYTDGISEARSPSGDFFSTEGLELMLAANTASRPNELVSLILKTVKDWSQGHHKDDTAVLVIGRDA